ncbi:MAG: xanthine dehydrogenase family protein molybdopterin-binding subunit, partial [Chloroflexi bacterium]|nr:xanthine dehydrogenase family protein molybdopterin-binding subunit [Chloroflexota bacterium]
MPSALCPPPLRCCRQGVPYPQHERQAPQRRRKHTTRPLLWRCTVTQAPATPAPGAQQFTVVGTRPDRHDGVDKVTGQARYSADIQLNGMLYGKILRSPHAHARIKSIDTSRALALPGVKAVVTRDDMPNVSADIRDLEEGALINYGFYSRNCMAREKALYRGHAVAAVAATSADIAEEALALISVDYEVLPAVLDGREAMKDGAPILHERLVPLTNASLRAGGYGDSEKRGNVSNHYQFILGAPEEAMRQAEVVVEREFHTEQVHQGYIEPHAATAYWRDDGYLTIWCSSQSHFGFRDHISRMLQLPYSRVKVVPMEIGGGFGAKGVGGVYLEPVAAMLSKKSGRPVKITMGRAEVFTGTGPTSGTHIRVRMGARKDGRIVAADARLIYEAGAFPGSPVGGACRTMFGPYDIANARIDAYDVVINVQKAAAYRAPGSPAGAYAVESVVDELCEKLGMDPIAFRLLNASNQGTRQVPGPVFGKVGNIEVLQAARSHPHYSAPLTGKYRGRGFASGAWMNGTGPASAVVSVNPDGTITLIEGSPDIGGSRVAMAMHVAEVLGVPAEDVRPAVVDTDSIGYSSGAGGSGVTFKMGTACYQAAQDALRQLVERAAKIWNVAPTDVEYRNGTLQHKTDSALSMTLKQLAHRLNGSGGPIVGRATANPPGVGNAFAHHIVDVEVDPDTGKVAILRYTAVQDVGKAVHPTYVEGQIQGGAAQGIGWALNEEYVYTKDGAVANPTFLDYRMPTSLDLPMIDTVLVEVPNPGHPYGVRGVGEVPIVPPLAAVANAVSRAIGVRLTELPMSPGKVLEALKQKA